MAFSACSAPEPGGVRFRVTTTPAPDDKVLSPLLDPRVSLLEIRSRDPGGGEAVLGRARYEAGPGGSIGDSGPLSLSLGQVPIFDRRDLHLMALGSGGQQVLGLAVARDAEVRYGEPAEFLFELRRPLFFFGSGRKLVPPVPFPPSEKILSPGRRIVDALRTEHLLRVVDPNSGTPLLSAYDLALDGTRQSTASAATSDGLSVLSVSETGALHVVDTLRLKAAVNLKLPTDMPAQQIVVSPRDELAAVLHYEVPTPATGTVGRITLLRDLPGLRKGMSNGDPLVLELKSEAAAPLGAPLSAAYAPDGLLDVVFGRPPLSGGEPNCAQLTGMKSVLRRLDPRSGQVAFQAALSYTTAVAYDGGGQQLLLQPCATPAAGNRPGQVVFQRFQGEMFVQLRALPAPGSADLSIVAGQPVLVGRDNVAESPDDVTQARGVVRVLEPGLSDWSPLSPFPLADWLLPYRVTTVGGEPLPASLEIVLAPRDLLVYRIVATPDRSRALVAARVTHAVSDALLDVFPDVGGEYTCSIDWVGYTYHVMLVNLQTGAQEQDFLVGVQNQSCNSRLRDPSDKVVGLCFSECQFKDMNGVIKNGRLRGYQEGLIPTGTSALFSGQ